MRRRPVSASESDGGIVATNRSTLARSSPRPNSPRVETAQHRFHGCQSPIEFDFRFVVDHVVQESSRFERGLRSGQDLIFDDREPATGQIQLVVVMLRQREVGAIPLTGDHQGNEARIDTVGRSKLLKCRTGSICDRIDQLCHRFS